ncbi:hypothetical protein EVAR_48322_1 [Eumeta japonica]|uniref:Uncharacterized protein n=1 Tax=Eumeta variegata TaxID=151549 RepID=A0A4C1WN21_EUMVA|nr:hypothetical protein EVAR_48322_1 [Eumeta japonica]
MSTRHAPAAVDAPRPFISGAHAGAEGRRRRLSSCASKQPAIPNCQCVEEDVSSKKYFSCFSLDCRIKEHVEWLSRSVRSPEHLDADTRVRSASLFTGTKVLAATPKVLLNGVIGTV